MLVGEEVLAELSELGGGNINLPLQCLSKAGEPTDKLCGCGEGGLRGTTISASSEGEGVLAFIGKLNDSLHLAHQFINMLKVLLAKLDLRGKSAVILEWEG